MEQKEEMIEYLRERRMAIEERKHELVLCACMGININPYDRLPKEVHDAQLNQPQPVILSVEERSRISKYFNEILLSMSKTREEEEKYNQDIQEHILMNERLLEEINVQEGRIRKLKQRRLSCRHRLNTVQNRLLALMIVFRHMYNNNEELRQHIRIIEDTRDQCLEHSLDFVLGCTKGEYNVQLGGRFYEETRMHLFRDQHMGISYDENVNNFKMNDIGEGLYRVQDMNRRLYNALGIEQKVPSKSEIVNGTKNTSPDKGNCKLIVEDERIRSSCKGSETGSEISQPKPNTLYDDGDHDHSMNSAHVDEKQHSTSSPLTHHNNTTKKNRKSIISLLRRMGP